MEVCCWYGMAGVVHTQQRRQIEMFELLTAVGRLQTQVCYQAAHLACNITKHSWSDVTAVPASIMLEQSSSHHIEWPSFCSCCMRALLLCCRCRRGR